ncbi:MAG: hypothetical protein FJ119_01065 [Deltaproteobacteria bacterium]|nr:hypothetical protein [Deltaproteobacteria bacterium]
MSDTSGTITARKNCSGKRGSRPVITVSSHMVNHPAGLQAARTERTRQSLLSACPACRARSAEATTCMEFVR